MSVLEAGITGLANIIGTGINAVQSRRNIRATNKANRQLAEYSFNKNLEMWNLQNQYNSPQSQMQRLQEAGLNPHLMYGKGTVGNAQAMPSYVAPQQDYRGMQSMVGSMAQAGLGTIAQMQQIEMQKEAIYNAERENWVQDNLAELRVLTGEIEYDRAIINAKKENFEKQTAQNIAYIKQIESKLASSGLTLRDAVWLRAGAMVLSGIDDDLPILGPLKNTFKQFFNVFDLELKDIEGYEPAQLREFIVEPGKKVKWKFNRRKW